LAVLSDPPERLGTARRGAGGPVKRLYDVLGLLCAGRTAEGWQVEGGSCEWAHLKDDEEVRVRLADPRPPAAAGRLRLRSLDGRSGVGTGLPIQSRQLRLLHLLEK